MAQELTPSSGSPPGARSQPSHRGRRHRDPGEMPPKSGAKSAYSDSSSKEGKKGKVQQKEEDGEFLILPALQNNMRTLSHARIFSGVIAGVVAGLLKCEGLAGVFVFILVTVAHSAMMFAKMSFNAHGHFPKSSDVFVSQFTSGLLPFILFWTLAFDMVHIF
uniref:ER membrane protein complex subunit 6 n=1 Tax=Alexandrium catenella TaxID=2925 RepID=A0A7S1QRC8_ALECA